MRTARYFEIGDLDSPVDDLWFVLHGYGQSAREFAEPFNDYAAEGRLIVLPEALSRFYVSHEGPVIGACWMTKEDRKSEIRDYIRYLNALYQEVTGVSGVRNTRLTVLGFSQGTATATRWLASGDVTADRLILWGGASCGRIDNERVCRSDEWRANPVCVRHTRQICVSESDGKDA
ncbi:MAG: hypothetical protein IIA50_02090 [Bacteroidetes bacterium]|nr:hypothetical protein [Bacteroidota bacterium]